VYIDGTALMTDTTGSATAAPRRRRQSPLAAVASAASPANDAFIREAECRRISGLSRSTRWRLERAGKFPRRRKISESATGWLASELAEWLAGRAAT
jgi:prophage regulatory protein